MKLVENWPQVLRSAWSVWVLILITAINVAQAALENVTPAEIGLSPKGYAICMAILSAIALIARILKQDFSGFLSDESGAIRLRRRGLAGVAAVSIALAGAFVAPWEGLRTSAYRDAVGVWTVCYGETKGVRPGDRYSAEECEAMLERELERYAAALGECLTAELPQGARVAFVSWSYNVGTGAACRSTLVRKANAGDLYGACDELLRWNRAGGRVLNGLTNRRKAERAMCIRALADAGIRRK